MNKIEPLVSIICPTYNQEKFIAETLDGFIMQKTTFPFEIIVHDDASTDSTATIVKNYENKYPQLFANIYQKENQYSKAIGNITKITFAAARGKYIALCEGDDYWVADNKLQTQIDFLESNPDFSICFHRVYELFMQKKEMVLGKRNSNKEEVYTIKDLAKENFIHTPSVVFRNRLFEKLPEWLLHSPSNDYALHLLNAKFGKIKYVPEPMAVYRRHDGGTWGNKGDEYQLKKWLWILQHLTNEFDDSVAKILGEQYASTAMNLSYILHKKNEHEESRKYFKLAHETSESIVRCWAFENYDNYNKVSSSKEYRIGTFIRNPRYLLNIIKHKLKF